MELWRVSVRFRRPRERIISLKEFAIRWLQRRVEYLEHWALRDVDLVVRRGEILGVVGPNGAGKSTLLKVVAAVLHPTEGRVRVHGRVMALLELGMGFHPELTGRENVLLYGTMLGHSLSQMRRDFEQIVAFAGLEDVIDSPLRTYSSGMVARLGFAVATCQPADVLLVDEVLAVGDREFQDRCLARMEELRRGGATILYVTHALEQVRSLCDRVVWLESGRVREMGPAWRIVARYKAA